jgi:hypothetical protein
MSNPRAMRDLSSEGLNQKTATPGRRRGAAVLCTSSPREEERGFSQTVGTGMAPLYRSRTPGRRREALDRNGCT